MILLPSSGPVAGPKSESAHLSGTSSKGTSKTADQAPVQQTTGAGATAVTGPESVQLLARGPAVAAPGGGKIIHCGLPH